MPLSLLTNLAPRSLSVSPPGGDLVPNKLLSIHPHVVDRIGRNITDFKWPARDMEAPCPYRNPDLPQDPLNYASQCNHSPLDNDAADCACNLETTSAPSTPRSSHTFGCSTPRSPRSRSRFSDGTVQSRSESSTDEYDDLFDTPERPAAQPHISPLQLPPLCPEYDSDDEAYVAGDGSFEGEHAASIWHASARFEEGSNGNEEEEDEVEPDEDPVSKSQAWLDKVLNEAPLSPHLNAGSDTSFEFRIILPKGAPMYPSVSIAESCSLQRSTPLVPSAKVHRPLFHPRPCDDDLFTKDILDLTRYEDHDKIHGLLLERSDAPHAESYAQASKGIQAAVRELIVNYPQFRVDIVTPSLERVDFGQSHLCPYTCVFSDCQRILEPSVVTADVHIEECHVLVAAAQRDSNCAARLDCPACQDIDPDTPSVPVMEFGRHMLEVHRRERAVPQLRCKICCALYSGVDGFIKHFDKCADKYAPEAMTPRPAKRRRVACIPLRDLLNADPAASD